MEYKVTKIGKTGQVTTEKSLLDNLLRGVDMKLFARVGIMGAKNKRTKSGKGQDVGNADIGLAHEKGIKSINLPRRSWLQTPLEDNLSEAFNALGAKAIQKMLTGNYFTAYAQLGVVAENIIQKGFETGGYGKWAPLSQVTISKKKSDAILIDTAQLRRSVTSEVVSK